MTEFLAHELSNQGEFRQLESLIRMGKVADVDQQDEEYGLRTPLHLAASKGHVRCCKILLENGANASSLMDMNWTPAHCASENGHLGVLQVLADYGAKFHKRDAYGATPQRIAEIYGHTECAEFIASKQKELVPDIQSRQNSNSSTKRPLLSASKQT